MTNRMGRIKKPKLHSGKIPCVRCHEPMFNEFRSQPWCSDCGLELQQMNMNGEEVLELMLAITPPPFPDPNMHVRVTDVQKIIRKALMEKGLILGYNDQDETGQSKSRILTG